MLFCIGRVGVRLEVAQSRTTTVGKFELFRLNSSNMTEKFARNTLRYSELKWNNNIFKIIKIFKINWIFLPGQIKDWRVRRCAHIQADTAQHSSQKPHCDGIEVGGDEYLRIWRLKNTF